MKLRSGDQLVQFISSDAPLGRGVLGICEADKVSLEIAASRQQFELLKVH